MKVRLRAGEVLIDKTGRASVLRDVVLEDDDPRINGQRHKFEPVPPARVPRKKKTTRRKATPDESIGG